MADKRYPYENKSIKNIRNEVWKDIPGFENEIEVTLYTSKSLMSLFRKYYEIKSKNLN